MDVEHAQARWFALAIGVDRAGIGDALRAASASVVVRSLDEIEVIDRDEERARP